ncbi:hypothetical protein AVEN_210100-1 [Araneus ventricosus]|uniref:Uncharacterized protein n=1 Tax=Araneus ventricosus TaxID=182803 RepID=A0A4Y2G9E6_ARAVE|nr:hypothetical protein AVEN_210100-1 [Araneus ventricosus]
MAFRKCTVEQIEERVIACGADISLGDIHFYYQLLARKDPSEKTPEQMIKLQTATEKTKFLESTNALEFLDHHAILCTLLILTKILLLSLSA